MFPRLNVIIFSEFSHKALLNSLIVSLIRIFNRSGNHIKSHILNKSVKYFFLKIKMGGFAPPNIFVEYYFFNLLYSLLTLTDSMMLL